MVRLAELDTPYNSTHLTALNSAEDSLSCPRTGDTTCREPPISSPSLRTGEGRFWSIRLRGAVFVTPLRSCGSAGRLPLWQPSYYRIICTPYGRCHQVTAIILCVGDELRMNSPAITWLAAVWKAPNQSRACVAVSVASGSGDFKSTYVGMKLTSHAAWTTSIGIRRNTDLCIAFISGHGRHFIALSAKASTNPIGVAAIRHRNSPCPTSIKGCSLAIGARFSNPSR